MSTYLNVSQVQCFISSLCSAQATESNKKGQDVTSYTMVIASAVMDQGATHSLIGADGVNLGTEHDGGEDEEEESFETQ